MDEKEKKQVLLEYAGLAIEAKISGQQIPTAEMETMAQGLGLSHKDMLAKAFDLLAPK